MHMLEHERHDLVENVEALRRNKECKCKIEELTVEHIVERKRVVADTSNRKERNCSRHND